MIIINNNNYEPSDPNISSNVTLSIEKLVVRGISHDTTTILPSFKIPLPCLPLTVSPTFPKIRVKKTRRFNFDIEVHIEALEECMNEKLEFYKGEHLEELLELYIK
ncbi:STP1 protein [Plasmodium brasilianum]|uniref:STP1 protein n=1 Tax=Plasmodium brasilianum TaxID=5824 RepID=A0ACB9YFR8_PLABR|nr:STP1 protein [Plasmodium brasilianum]